MIIALFGKRINWLISMPISHDHKCLFIHIPRTGGTSFRKILGIDKEDEDSIPKALERINGKGLLSMCNRNPELPSHKVPRVLYKEHLCMKHIYQLSLVDNKIYSEYLKFAFVRNPWDRALSVYSNHYYVYCKDFRDFVNKIKVIVPFIENAYPIVNSVINSFFIFYPFCLNIANVGPQGLEPRTDGL